MNGPHLDSGACNYTHMHHPHTDYLYFYRNYPPPTQLILTKPTHSLALPFSNRSSKNATLTCTCTHPRSGSVKGGGGGGEGGEEEKKKFKYHSHFG